MEGGPLSTDEFAAFSKDVIPYLHVTTRIEGRENDDLLSVYGFRGFPSLAYLDVGGKKLVEPQGRDVASFKEGAKTVNELMDLRAKVAAGDKSAAPKLLMVELELGAVSYADAKEQLSTFKDLDPAMKKKIGKLLLNAEVRETLASIQSEEAAQKAGATFAKYAREGKIPTGDAADGFWSIISDWAEKNVDPDLFEKAYKHLKGKYGDNERNAQYFQKMAERLEAIRTEAAKEKEKP